MTKLLVPRSQVFRGGWIVTKYARPVRQMVERQINSLLYDRLMMSQDKESVLAIAKGEALPTEPHHILKACSTIGCCNASSCSTSKLTKSRTKIWGNSRCTSTTTTAT